MLLWRTSSWLPYAPPGLTYTILPLYQIYQPAIPASMELYCSCATSPFGESVPREGIFVLICKSSVSGIRCWGQSRFWGRLPEYMLASIACSSNYSPSDRSSSNHLPASVYRSVSQTEYRFGSPWCMQGWILICIPDWYTILDSSRPASFAGCGIHVPHNRCARASPGYPRVRQCGLQLWHADCNKDRCRHRAGFGRLAER